MFYSHDTTSKADWDKKIELRAVNYAAVMIILDSSEGITPFLPDENLPKLIFQRRYMMP